MAALPMFPLGTVLLPGGVMPLHVFEPRYRQMIKDCMASDAEFGVTLIERGSEVGGGDVRSEVGTVARIRTRAPMSKSGLMSTNRPASSTAICRLPSER
jgi:Lon protease-like protein